MAPNVTSHDLNFRSTPSVFAYSKQSKTGGVNIREWG